LRALTPATQRSPQHSEFTAQDWSKGLQGDFLASRVASSAGAATAKVAKAKAKRMVDLKNCILFLRGIANEMTEI
jgi:hypothetical protein